PAELNNVVLPAPDTIPVPVSIAYAITSGRLVLQLSGVPDQVTPAIHVTGPGLDRMIARGDTLVGLVPAVYGVAAANVVSNRATYAPSAGNLSVAVAADPVPAVAQVSYRLTTGTLQVTTSGLPAGASAGISVTGPGGFTRAVTGSELLVGLAPGTYSIAAGNVLVADQLYLPAQGLQTRVVSPGLVPELVEVSYAPATATLAVNLSGLPVGTAANVGVSGPG